MSSIPTSLPKQFPMVCRTNPKLWWMVALGSLETAFMLFTSVLATDSSPAPQDPWELVVMGGFGAILFGSITGYLATELLRSEIRADEQGLTWRRGFAHWKSARWEEISDFYIPKHSRERIVETSQGKLTLSSSFVGVQKIVALVPTYATNSLTHQWGRKGFRHEDEWSLSLSTWSKAHYWTAPILTAFLLCYVFCLLNVLFFSPDNTNQGHDAFAVGAMALIYGSAGLPMICLVFTLWRERRFAWQHRNETLVLNGQGLIFSPDQTRLEAKWEELRTIERLEPQNKFRRILVHTDQGDFVIWVITNSTMWQQFRRLAQEYAPWSMEALLKKEAQEPMGAYEDLDGPRGAWSGPNVGEGARVFSVRSRSNRLILLCVSIALLFAPNIYLITLYSPATEESSFVPRWPAIGGTCFGVVVILGALLLWFRRTSVWVDGEGLLLHWPLRSPRRVRWEEIEGIGRNAWGEWVLTPSRKIYFTFLLNPLRHDELLQLIESRGQKPPSSADDFASS